MIWFFIAVLAVSIVGMLSMLFIKRWELRTGRLLFAPARPRVSQAVEKSAFVAGTVAPLVARHWWEYALEWLKLFVHRAIAFVVLVVEKNLERVLRHIKHTTDPRKLGGEASAFLREVAEHKKQIQNQLPE